MNNNMMSPLPTFTLESLVTNGQWTAAQNNNRKKLGKAADKKRPRNSELSEKASKPTL